MPPTLVKKISFKNKWCSEEGEFPNEENFLLKCNYRIRDLKKFLKVEVSFFFFFFEKGVA